MIGKRIKELRIHKNLKQSDVAEYLDVSRTTLSHYETGVTEPDIAIINKLAHVFEVSSDYLLGRTDAPDLGIREESAKASPPHDFHVENLPEEAIRKIEEYIELIKLKYRSDKSKEK